MDSSLGSGNAGSSSCSSWLPLEVTVHSGDYAASLDVQRFHDEYASEDSRTVYIMRQGVNRDWKIGGEIKQWADWVQLLRLFGTR